MMEREISDKAFIGNTVSHYADIGKSPAVDRTTSN